MTVVINGTTGITSVNGSAAAPSVTGTDTDTGIVYGTNTVSIATGGTERLQVDSSGNVGLGVTPSAWYNTYKALQVKTLGFSSGGGGYEYLLSNIYIGAGDSYKYVGNGYGVAYEMNVGAGKHIWKTAGNNVSGADATATVTQVMTLDASGNLGIGETSPSTKLHVKGTSTFYGDGSYPVQWGDTSGIGRLTYSTNNAIIQAVGASTVLSFQTNSAERARIDTSGNLLVGTTSGSSKLYLTDSSAPANQSVYFDNTNSSFAARVLSINASRNTTNGTYKFFSCSISTVAEKFYVFDSGSAYNSTGTYGTISDIKLKENIVDATPKLADVMRLQVRNFNFKTEPNEKQLGFVAQELEQVFPAMVQETQDRDEDGELTGETTKQVKTTVLIPILVKAIQEQQAIIESLKARLDAANL